jgi:tripartite-type tricarboxylate transporter receptor subunit TctC
MIARLGLMLAVAASAAFVTPATAEDSTPASYPSRPVHLIVPFAAGGPADVYARYVGQYLSQTLKQSFVIEDRPRPTATRS